MPEEILDNIRSRIPLSMKVCFVSAMLAGFLAHFYKITNWLPNWDSLVFRYDAQNMIGLGRWFLPVVCAPRSFYDLPWIAGVTAILFHALGALCICGMFHVRKNLTAVMIGAAVVTFPTVTSTLMYNYVADGYAIAFFLSCMAALLLTREKPDYLWAVLCITLSCGIYQAYITVTVMLLLCYLILETLKKETAVGGLLAKSGCCLLAGMVGMVLYYLVLLVLLKVTGMQLSGYQGIDNTASFAGIDILGALYVIKQSFLDYFFPRTDGISVFAVLNCVILVMTVILYLAELIRNRIHPCKVVLLAVYVLFLPIGASVLALINSGIDYHNLMKMGFFVFYLFLILQYENDAYKRPERARAKAWSILLTIAVLVFHNSIVANVSYHKLQMSYEKSYGTLIRIADRMEQTEGAAECDRILVIGALADSEAYSVMLPPDMTGTTDGYILRADDEVLHQSVLCSALNDYCGTDYTFLWGEEKAALLEKISEEDMGIWPASDAILTVDNVIVIRLGKEEP